MKKVKLFLFLSIVFILGLLLIFLFFGGVKETPSGLSGEKMPIETRFFIEEIPQQYSAIPQYNLSLGEEKTIVLEAIQYYGYNNNTIKMNIELPPGIESLDEETQLIGNDKKLQLKTLIKAIESGQWEIVATAENQNIDWQTTRKMIVGIG